MGIWDKSKLLDGLRMDEEYEPGTPFALYGMKVGGEVDLGNGLPPATKTIMLTEECASDGSGRFVALKDREVKVVGTLSGPIGEMASQADAGDFPVVVSWEAVATKTREKATVLNYHGEWEHGEAPEIPGDWNRF